MLLRQTKDVVGIQKQKYCSKQDADIEVGLHIYRAVVHEV